MKKKLLFICLCLVLCLTSVIRIDAVNYYYWAISKDLETLYLSASVLDNTIEDLYSVFGDFDSDINTTWVMPWSTKINVDGTNYYTTDTIKNVVIEDGMTPKSITRWFLNFRSIESIDLSNLNTSELTYMVETFENCKSLKSITFGNDFDTSKVTEFDACFAGSENLETLDLSNFVIQEDVSMDGSSGTFLYELNNLKEIKLPRIIKTKFSIPGELKWVDEAGNIVDVADTGNAGQTLKKVNGYGLVVENVLVTDTNCTDILKDGKVSYDPSSKTLTLDNVTLTKCFFNVYSHDFSVIYTNDSLNINLIGDNKIVIPKLEDEYSEEWAIGIYFPMMFDDGDFELSFSGDNLTIEGEDNEYNRGIMTYDSDCVITNSANISMNIPGNYNRAIYSAGDFTNNGKLDILASGTHSWGIDLDHDTFENNGYVLTRADEGAFCAKEVIDEQHLIKGCVSKSTDIATFEDVEFIADIDDPYYDEFVVDGQRIKSFVLCNKELVCNYIWNSDYSKCKAVADCDECGYHIEEEVDSTHARTREATYNVTQIDTYTADFTNSVFEQQKVDVEGSKKPYYPVPNTSVY